MMKMNKAIPLALLAVLSAFGQTSPTGLMVTSIPGLTSSWAGECGANTLDNRSAFLRQNIYHSVAAQGTGTWSVTIQYSNTSCSGPWSSYGSAATINQASNPAIALAYDGPFSPAQFINIAITGNAIANYTGQKGLYIPPSSTGTVTYPISLAQGGTGSTTSIGAKAALNIPIINPADYNFTAQAPGGSLIAGGVNQSITMTPCPWGIAGTYTSTYVYLSGGTGTAEATKITGGTCTPGAASGTITVTPTYSHSGAFTVGSASAGLQEAANAAIVSGQPVTVPGGSYAVYAPIGVTAPVTITCSNSYTTTLIAQTATQDIIDINYVVAYQNQPTVIAGCGFGAAVTKTAGAAINISNAAASAQPIQIYNNWFEGQFYGILAVNSFYMNIHDNSFHGGNVSGTYIQLSSPYATDGGDSMIRDNWFFGLSNCINYLSGGGLRIIGNKLLDCETAVNAVWASGAGSSQFIVSDNTFDGPQVNGLVIGAADSTVVFTDMSISGNIFTGSPTDSLLKVNANSATVVRAQITGNNFLQGGGTGTVLNLISGSGFNVVGNVINSAPNSSATALYIGSALSYGSVAENFFSTYINLGFNLSSSSTTLVANNAGALATPQAFNVATTTAFTVPTSIVDLQNNGTVTTFTPPTGAPGQQWTVISVGTSTWSAGSTIGNTCTMSAGKPYTMVWDGTKVWIMGNGC